MTKLTTGDKFTIGTTDYTVIREKKGYNGETLVVATYKDLNGYDDFYTFNKNNI